MLLAYPFVSLGTGHLVLITCYIRERGSRISVFRVRFREQVSLRGLRVELIFKRARANSDFAAGLHGDIVNVLLAR